MADNLMDTIKKRLSEQQPAQDLGIGTGAASQQLLQAKSGKAVAGTSGPAASSLGEQQAAQAGQQALGQVQKEGAIKGLQIQQQGEEQLQAADLNQQQLQQKTQAFRQEADRTFDGLMQERSLANKELDFNKRRAIDEQIGFLERLGNEKYITQLQQAGARARLDDALSFKTQLQKDYYSGMEDLIEKDIAFKSLLDAGDRDFNKKLASMDIDTAMAILSGNIQAANTGAIWSGAAGVVSGGIAAAEKFGEKKPMTDAESEQLKTTYSTSGIKSDKTGMLGGGT
jgi:hypothetical protein